MKKIFPLLFVLFLDFVLLTAADEAKEHMPTPFFPLILLFTTLVVTLILFYDKEFVASHRDWLRFKEENNPENVKLEEEMAYAPTHTTTQPIQQKPTLPSGQLPQNKSTPLRKKLRLPLFSKNPKNLSLEMQYQFIDLVRQEIIDLRKAEKSDGEIIKQLNKESWDPQVIYIALSRTKKEEKAA